MKREKQNVFVVALFLLVTFLMFSCEKDYFQWSLPEKGDLEISVVSITNNNVKIKGNILTKKVGSIIEAGFLITSTGDFSIADKYIVESNSNNVYQFDFQGFNFNTSYQARFYIITKAGLSQSSSVQFTTLNIPGSPAVVLNNYTDLLSDKVTVSGQVTLEGDFPVLARGFCWSTSSNPTVNNSLSNNGAGLGYFSQTITNLDPNTDYYVRAYASNQISTTYSNQIEFKTSSYVGNISSINCSSATNIGSMTAGIVVNAVSSSITYTGGNGGPYNGQSINSTGVTGLTATISSGIFTNSSGSLTFNITGTPNSGGIANFEINIGGQNCTLSRTVGASLNIGDYHQGGLIFYIFHQGDLGYVLGEVHGLIAAPQNQGSNPWGCYGTSISTDASLGSGYINTQNIVNNCGQPNIAARICDTLTLNGYYDWYLPSSFELILLYENLYSSGLGNIYDYYWSSTQSTINGAVFITFATGYGEEVGNKQLSYKVRAIRSF